MCVMFISHKICVEVREQFSGPSSFHLLCGSWVGNSGYWAWKQVSLSDEPSGQLYGEYSASIFYCKSAPYNPFALNRLQSAEKIETRIYEILQHPIFDSLSWFPLSLKSRTYNCGLNLIHIRYAKSYFMLILPFVS